MKLFKTYWKHLNTIPEGYEFKIRGINIWNQKWEDTGEKVLVKDPLYRKEYSLTIWKIQLGEFHVKIAAGEFSNCMWGIYIERKKISFI